MTSIQSIRSLPKALRLKNISAESLVIHANRSDTKISSGYVAAGASLMFQEDYSLSTCRF